MPIIKMYQIIFVFFATMTVSYASGEGIFRKTSDEIRQYVKHSQPLDETALKNLVTEHTAVGHTCDTHEVYEFFFKKDGTIIFRKSREKSQVYIGKWWVKGNSIFSQWKTYRKKPTVNQLQYYHVMENIYVPYNINVSCGPAGTYQLPFMMFEGNPFDLPV